MSAEPRRGAIPSPPPADVVAARDLTPHACRALTLESPKVENKWPTRTADRLVKLFRFRPVEVFSIQPVPTAWRRKGPSDSPVDCVASLSHRTMGSRPNSRTNGAMLRRGTGHSLTNVNICADPGDPSLPAWDIMAQKAPKKGRKASNKRVATTRKDAIPRLLLAREVRRRVEKSGLSRNVAALVLGDAPSQMSRLMTGHVREFSSDRLMGFLLRLGADVTITIKHSRRLGGRGKMRVKLINNR
jgi:predicted XRE-type DNA-binding protein